MGCRVMDNNRLFNHFTCMSFKFTPKKFKNNLLTLFYLSKVTKVNKLNHWSENSS